MARIVAKSRELVHVVISSFGSLRESVFKVFPVEKHPTLRAYVLEGPMKACREHLLEHYSRLRRQVYSDYVAQVAGIKPNIAKTVPRTPPRFEQSRVDLNMAALTAAKKLFARAGFGTQNLSGCRSFFCVTRAAWSSKLTAHGPQVQIFRNVRLGRRMYHTDEQGYRHFKERGPRAWLQRPEGGYLTDRRLLVVVVIVGGSAYIYYTHSEVVPYTHRKHFVIMSPEMERELGEKQFETLKQQWRKEILPPFHPSTIKVTRVAKEIIGTVMSAVGEDRQSINLQHQSVSRSSSPDQAVVLPGDGWEPTPAHFHSHGDPTEIYGKEEGLDDEWVERTRQKGLEQGQRGYLDHLKGMKWEIVVVDLDVLNAMCLPGGKIVVFTGLLKQFPTDTEIATVLGHEVGHAVARHVAEKVTQAMWLGFLRLTALVFFNMPAIINDLSELLIALPFSRRMELEADHIGLVLMSAAGFDPVPAPSFYETLGKLEKSPRYLEYLSTHPLAKKRSESLRNSETMQRAKRIYEERLQGRLDLGRYL